MWVWVWVCNKNRDLTLWCSWIQQTTPSHNAIGGKWPSRFKMKNGASLCWKNSVGHLLQFLRADPLCQGFIFLTDVLNLSSKTWSGRAVASSTPQEGAQSSGCTAAQRSPRPPSHRIPFLSANAPYKLLSTAAGLPSVFSLAPSFC